MKTIVFLLIAVSAFAVDTGTDVDICSAAPDYTGDYITNWAGFWNPNNECWALIRFDIDAFEDDAVISLVLYHQEPGRTYSVYEIIEDWDSGVTWNTQPDTGDKVGELKTAISIVYKVKVPRITEYGWMIKNDLGETPPIDIWSFESNWPPELNVL